MGRIERGSNRVFVRGWLAAAALALVSLSAHSRNDPRFDEFLWQQGSAPGSGSIGAGGSGTGLPTSPSGASNTQVGRTTVNHPAGGWPHVEGKVRVPAGATGKYFDLLVKQNVNKQASARVLARTIGGIAGGVAGAIVLPVAIDLLMDELGLDLDPATGEIKKPAQGCTVAPCYWHMAQPMHANMNWTGDYTAVGACQKMVTEATRVYGSTSTYTFTSVTGTAGGTPGPVGGPGNTSGQFCNIKITTKSNGVVQNTSMAMYWQHTNPVSGGTTLTVEQLEAEIASKSGWPSTSVVDRAMAEALNLNIVDLDGFWDGIKTITPDGPTTVNVLDKITTNSDGSSVQEQTTCALVISTDGSGKVDRKCTITTTTTTPQTNPDGTPAAPKVETKTETGSKVDGSPSNPDSTDGNDRPWGDPPTGEVPKSETAVSYTAENMGWGSGSCPANPTWSDVLGSHTINLAPYCTAISSWVRPLVLAMAALMALAIVTPGFRSES